VQVVFSKRAQRQFETAVAWWREHREAAPFLLEDEVQATVKLLTGAPFSGAPGRDVRMQDVRRLILRDTRYLLFYRVHEVRGVVEILRLWHASRQAPRR